MSFGGEHMKPMLSVGKYFSFVITLTMSLGIVFELPIVMLILSKFGIVNHQRLVKKRKYALLIIVIITAIITPTPDAITLLAVSVPLIMLFELSIWLIFVYEKVFSRKKLEDEANEKKAS